MPYNADGSDVPARIKGSRKRRQFAHVWNSEYSHQLDAGKSKEEAESIAFASATSVVENAKVEKATDNDIADSIVRSLQRRFAKLPSQVRSSLEQAALSGAAQGMLQVDVGNAKLLASANDAAKDYATERAAELVGMKYDNEGNLVDNPNAKWAISETTRDKIRKIIADAFKKNTEMAKIRRSIQRALRTEKSGGGIFSEARAAMIARTEVMRAQANANFDVWRKSGVVRKIQWTGVGDEKECEYCSSNDGVSVPLGSPFPSGAIMPGDDHPTCRCVLVVSEFTS